jgi:hypothetical protein
VTSHAKKNCCDCSGSSNGSYTGGRLYEKQQQDNRNGSADHIDNANKGTRNDSANRDKSAGCDDSAGQGGDSNRNTVSCGVAGPEVRQQIEFTERNIRVVFVY